MRPKIIFLRDYSVINQYQLGEIYNLNYKKKIFTSIGFPLPSKSFYKYFDKIYFRNTNVLDRQGSYAKEYKLIFHSFNEKILEKIKIKNLEDRKINLSFCGSVQSILLYITLEDTIQLLNFLSKKLISIFSLKKTTHLNITCVFLIT